MTTETRTTAPELGRAVAQAHRPLVALRDDVLRADGTSFDAWIAMYTLAARGGAMPGDELRHELAVQLEGDPWSVAELLDRLEAAGDLRLAAGDGVRVELTREGASHHRRLREKFGHTAASVLEELDPADVETTMGVLRDVAERARSLRAS
jgi:DNA-binding MarR family transcriptional regulator